ncbi:MAG: hypothetical protein HQK54_04875 [Oligoflexales bacterium]|nr:hypothetical protein [Oligoflexales bacterium]
MTEWSSVVSEGQLASAIRHMRKILRDLAYLEFNYYFYWLGASERSDFAGEELIYRPAGRGFERTKLYYILKELFNRVPKGSVVRTLGENNDPGLESFGPDNVDMLSFAIGGKMVIVLVNPTSDARSFTVSGVTGENAVVLRTSESEDMNRTGTFPVRDGQLTIELPAMTILLIEIS